MTRPPRASSTIGFRADKDSIAARSIWTEDAFEIADEIEVSLRRVRAMIGLGAPDKATGHLLILRNLVGILETQLRRWKEQMDSATQI